jgi:plastocyanin
MVALLVGAALGVASCGGDTSAGNIAEMTASAFAQQSVTIPAGSAVHFVDDVDGATHQLCLGTNGECHSTANGPVLLRSPGMSMRAGQSKDVVFPAAGTYAVTCTIHPQMKLTITVH